MINKDEIKKLRGKADNAYRTFVKTLDNVIDELEHMDKKFCELEGLYIGDSVYSVGDGGTICEYVITNDSYELNGKMIYWVESGNIRIVINEDGVCGYNSAKFYRTKERAEASKSNEQ